MQNTAASKAGASASTAIPALCRILLLYVEPVFAFSGALLVFFKPESYLSTMTRGAFKSANPLEHFIYTELAGGWLHFAFTEAIVLRFVDDVFVWRLLCAGMLLSDLAYTHSCAEAVSGWTVWIDVIQWTAEDWTVTLTTWPFLFSRIAIVLGIGFRGSTAKLTKAPHHGGI